MPLSAARQELGSVPSRRSGRSRATPNLVGAQAADIDMGVRIYSGNKYFYKNYFAAPNPSQNTKNIIGQHRHRVISHII
jgi:hypothetical protein